MTRGMTPAGFIMAALRDLSLPAGARSLGRGWAVWVIADIEYRVLVARVGDTTRWRVLVGDACLGPVMDNYGRLSVPLELAGAGVGWPTGNRLESHQTTAVKSLCRDALSFAGSRRELALLMMSCEAVRHGDLVASLPVSGWPGRLAQALVLATDLDDRPLAGRIRHLITSAGTRVVSRRPRHRPDTTQAERDRLDALYLDRGDLEQDVEREARYWLSQYCKVLNRTIDL